MPPQSFQRRVSHEKRPPLPGPPEGGPGGAAPPLDEPPEGGPVVNPPPDPAPRGAVASVEGDADVEEVDSGEKGLTSPHGATPPAPGGGV